LKFTAGAVLIVAALFDVDEFVGWVSDPRMVMPVFAVNRQMCGDGFGIKRCDTQDISVSQQLLQLGPVDKPARRPRGRHGQGGMRPTSDSATAENWQQVRLQVDTRKWAASKILPKQYGDKVQQEVTGADGAPLLPTLSVVVKRE
jgi:hypothetical protein